MMCWYCYWGWPKPVFDIYDEAVEKLGGNTAPMHFGPAHIVWEDENFDLAENCLAEFGKYRNDFSPESLDVVKWSLEELIKVPLSIRALSLEYETAADANSQVTPEDYPPPIGMSMIKRFDGKGYRVH